MPNYDGDGSGNADGGGGYGGYGGDGGSNNGYTTPSINMPAQTQNVFNSQDYALADQNFTNGMTPGQISALTMINPTLGLIGGISNNFSNMTPEEQAATQAQFDSMQSTQSGANPMTTSTSVQNNPYGGNFSSMEDAGLFGMDQAQSLYGQGYNPYTFGQDSQNAQNQIRNTASQPNPYINGALNTTQSQMNNENPFLQGFESFQNQQNSQLGNMFDQGANQIQDSMNSQFGVSGRTGSGYHSGTTANAIGDFGTNLYGNAFDSMQNRNLSALNSGSSAWNQDQTRSLEAAGMMPSLSQSRYTDPLMLQSLGETVDQNNFDNSNSGWNNLNNYTNTIAGLQGTQGVPLPEQQSVSNADKLLGLLGTGASIYNTWNGD